MGDATHGGKGDRNRSNNTTFRNGWDAIFGNEKNNIECVTPSKKAFLERLEMEAREREVMEEIIKFLEFIDLQEYPVQRAKELYKKFLTLR